MKLYIDVKDDINGGCHIYRSLKEQNCRKFWSSMLIAARSTGTVNLTQCYVYSSNMQLQLILISQFPYGKNQTISFSTKFIEGKRKIYKNNSMLTDTISSGMLQVNVKRFSACDLELHAVKHMPTDSLTPINKHAVHSIPLECIHNQN